EHYSDPCVGATVTPTGTPTFTHTPTRTPTRTPTPTCAAQAQGTPGPWANRADLPSPRVGLAVASDGTNIYAFAGRASSRHDESYKYDYATDSWTPIAAMTPGLGIGSGADYGHNGKIYVTGGTTEAPSANRIYD